MQMRNKLRWLIPLSILFGGCDRRDKEGNLLKYKVSLYSEGKVIKSWASEGTPYSADNGTFEFTDSEGKENRISGTVIVEPLEN